MLCLDKHENKDPIFNKLVASWYADLLLDSNISIEALCRKLAGMLYISPHNLFFSMDVVAAIYQAYISPNDKVLCSLPLAARQQQYLQKFSAQALTIDYQPRHRGPWLDTNKLIEIISTEKPKLVCFSNVDGATGVAIKPSVIRQILDAARNVNTLVYIEEAYYPFYDQTVLPWIDEYSNLLVEHSFTNLWGLTSVPFTYVAAHADVIAKLMAASALPIVDHVSVALVNKALNHQADLKASVMRLLAGKQYFLDAMQYYGFDAIDQAQGNFLQVNFGAQADAIHKALFSMVQYRHCNHASLAGFSEFTVTTKEMFLPIVQAISQMANKKMIVDSI